MGCCVDMVWLRSALLALLVVSEAVDPIAPHVLVVVPPGQDAVVRLTGHDLDGDKLKAHVASVPASGVAGGRSTHCAPPPGSRSCQMSS